MASALTHAGLLVGLRALGEQVPVLGICVRRDADRQGARVARVAAALAAMIERPDAFDAGDVDVSDAVLAPGYGRLNEAVREGTQAFAERLQKEDRFCGGLTHIAVERQAQAGKEEGGSNFSTISNQLAFLNHPELLANTASSSFDPRRRRSGTGGVLGSYDEPVRCTAGPIRRDPRGGSNDSGRGRHWDDGVGAGLRTGCQKSWKGRGLRICFVHEERRMVSLLARLAEGELSDLDACTDVLTFIQWRWQARYGGEA